MKSRKDQVQAYFFVVGRLAAAVTHGQPDVLEAPSKRMTTGTVFGFVLAAVIMGVFGIVGMFAPSTGDSSWRQEGAIVMDKTSGARYVYLSGELRPVLNYSSARLVSAQAGGKLTSVSPAALAGTPVGQPIGISGAPDSLPEAGKVNTGAWTVCVQAAGSGAPAKNPAVTLLLGKSADTPLTGGQAFLVSTNSGRNLYLISRGKRFHLPNRSVAAALGYGAVRSVDVPSAWINTVPQGPDLVTPAVPGIGDPGPVINGKQSVVGQILQVRNSAIDSDQNYLVRRDGLAVLSRTGAALLLAAPSVRRAYPEGPVKPIQVGQDVLNGLPITVFAGLSSDLPPVPPEIVSPPPGRQPCVTQEPTVDGAGVVAGLLPDAEVLQRSAPQGTHQAGTLADRVGLEAGGGALARNVPAPGAAGGVTYLVTEAGKKYPLADGDATAALGYTESAAIPVPMPLLNLLPTGPVLSTNAARQTQPVRS